MLSESQKKALTAYIGECWHEDITHYDTAEFHKCSCGKDFTFSDEGTRYFEQHLTTNRTFLTGNDMVAVMEAIVKKGEWRGFLKYVEDEFEKVRDVNLSWTEAFLAWLFRPTDEAGEPHFCRLVCEWKGRE